MIPRGEVEIVAGICAVNAGLGMDELYDCFVS